MCIETRAGRLLCDTQIKYSPLHMCSGEDDKPSLNPSAEKHREKPHPLAYVYSCLSNLGLNLRAMPPISKLSMSSPWLLNATAAISFSLSINTLTPLILNELLEANNSFPCNTTGKMEVWTTNPNLQPKSEWECINYVSNDDLKE